MCDTLAVVEAHRRGVVLRFHEERHEAVHAHLELIQEGRVAHRVHRAQGVADVETENDVILRIARHACISIQKMRSGPCSQGFPGSKHRHQSKTEALVAPCCAQRTLWAIFNVVHDEQEQGMYSCILRCPPLCTATTKLASQLALSVVCGYE